MATGSRGPDRRSKLETRRENDPTVADRSATDRTTTAAGMRRARAASGSGQAVARDRSAGRPPAARQRALPEGGGDTAEGRSGLHVRGSGRGPRRAPGLQGILSVRVSKLAHWPRLPPIHAGNRGQCTPGSRGTRGSRASGRSTARYNACARRGSGQCRAMCCLAMRCQAMCCQAMRCQAMRCRCAAALARRPCNGPRRGACEGATTQASRPGPALQTHALATAANAAPRACESSARTCCVRRVAQPLERGARQPGRVAPGAGFTRGTCKSLACNYIPRVACESEPRALRHFIICTPVHPRSGSSP